ncbi:major facilitator superfamily domain-containing protein [Mycena vitilis]|nr:major facilitator superfamily domain-containing protein [Mycena vitilis]
MSIHTPQLEASKPGEIELAHRTPLPPSTSTFFALLPGTQSHQDSVSNDSRVSRVYLRDPRFASQKDATSLLPLIGTLSSGIIYCAGTIYRLLFHRRKSMWLGAVLCPGALLGASYATTIPQLIALQGVFYGIGAVLLDTACTSYICMSEWFVARRGMANGILFAGTSAGGSLLPLLLPPMISKYGISKTLRILGIAIAILLRVVLLPLMKPRLPQTRVHVYGPAPRGALRPQHWLQHHKSFLVFLEANTLQGFGYFVPILYLPTFANALHVSSSSSALTLTMVNEDDPAVSTIIYGYLLLFRGIGNILSTPISAKLYSQPHNVTGGLEKTGFNVGGGIFETMIIYVGTCFAAAAVSAVLGYAMDARKSRGADSRESE